MFILHLSSLIILMLPYCHSWMTPTYFNFAMQPFSYVLPQQIFYNNRQINYCGLNQFPTLNHNQVASNFGIQNISFCPDWNTNNLKTQTSLNQSVSLQNQLNTNCNKADKTKYGKKNAESNIVNQTFSFVSLKIKNHKALRRIFKDDQKKMETYYQFLKLWKKSNKKYINRKYIKELAQFDQHHPATKMFDKVNRANFLSKDQFRRAFRTLVNHYLQKICITTIITSSKLDKETMIDHLQRRRQVYQYFNYHMSLTGFKIRNKN